MNHSRDVPQSLLSEASALQHERAPRPLPLFLDMVRLVAERDPELGRRALEGLVAYQRAEREPRRDQRPVVAQAGPATLRDHGGSGAPAILVPSLINPPHVLDLDAQTSLAAAVTGMSRNVLLLDWGKASERSDLSVSDHVEQLLAPLVREVGPEASLIGYCLGGTMAIAAANLVPCERVATLAAPWHFSGYPPSARDALGKLWNQARGSAEAFGALPMEVLQAAFWSLDPQRTVAKFADFSTLPPGSPEARRFVALEDWANNGEPLPFPAARELIEDFFAADTPGRGCWSIAGKPIMPELVVPVLHCTASRDRIAPAETAAEGRSVHIGAGHVGMIVGSARDELHRVLADFL